MGKNNNLSEAKKNKNDEFYTQIEDINAEMVHYEQHFKGKTILMNCDDPTWSNFWRYFHLEFERLGLKKIISTHYEDGEVSTYKLEYEGGNDADFDVGVKTELEQNGDFRSPECVELLKEADIVVTNPPFSLFREYVALLMEYDKKFIVLSNMNAVTYKEFFPLIKENKVWVGNGFNISLVFKTPYPNLLEANRKYVISKGYNPDDGYVKTPAIAWFTNLDIKKRHDWIDTPYLYSKRDTLYPDLYPKYDNYDAINVDKVSEIPMDYDRVMGVPITFLDKYNPDQFEIVGISMADSPLMTKHYGDYIGYKQNGEKTGRTGSTFGACPVLVKNDHKTVYYEKDGIQVQATYCRIFIRKKQ